MPLLAIATTYKDSLVVMQILQPGQISASMQSDLAAEADFGCGSAARCSYLIDALNSVPLGEMDDDTTRSECKAAP